MPVLGTRDLSADAEQAPVMESLDTEVITLERVEILQVMFEIDGASVPGLLPLSLHPTIPPTVTWVVYRCPGGPFGAFSLAQTRVGCRAGVRPRGYLLTGVIDSPEAAAALAGRWGYRLVPGAVALRAGYHRIEAAVERDGARVLDVALVDPVPVSGADIQYVANMNLAHTPRGLRLVQVDPEFTFHRAERGRSEVTRFDAAAWGDAHVVPVHPVAASFTVADITLPRLRYLCRPDVSTLHGTEEL